MVKLCFASSQAFGFLWERGFSVALLHCLQLQVHSPGFPALVQRSLAPFTGLSGQRVSIPQITVCLCLAPWRPAVERVDAVLSPWL